MKKLFIIILLLCCTTAQAQYKKPYFNTLTVQNGLPENFIQATLEDKNGYLWMGTQNGLVRYDGYRFKPYPIFNTTGNIVSPIAIKSLMQDRKGKIWAYTRENGIYSYDVQANKFASLPLDIKTLEVLKSSNILSWIVDGADNTQWLLTINYTTRKKSLYKLNTVNYTLQEFGATGKLSIEKSHIIKDISGRIWLYGEGLLSYFDEATQGFKVYFTLPENLKDNSIIDCTIDPADANILWLNTYASTDVKSLQPELIGKNILRLNTRTKTFQQFSPNVNNPKSLPDNCLFTSTDSLNRVWFGTVKGISLYNVKQNNFTNYSIHFSEPNSCPESICTDKEDNLWISDGLQSLYFLNIKTGESNRLENNTYKGSLPAFVISNKLFFDKSGTLWVSMPWFGVAYLDRQKSIFSLAPIIPNSTSAKEKINFSQYDIRGTTGDSICFLADTSSLYTWHRRTNQVDRIDLKNKDAYKVIRDVVTGKDGSLWISTRGFGLFNYNPKTKLLKKFENNPKDSLSLSTNNIHTLAVDTDGTIWIGTRGKGLCSYSPQTNRFTNYPFIQNNALKKPKDLLDDSEVSSSLIGNDGIIWIGTNNGALNSYNKKTKKFRSFIDPEQRFFSVNSIYEDRQKRLWAGTFLSGLFLVDRKTGTLKRYTEADGILHNEIQTITEDESGNIWCSTPRGFFRLNPANNSIDNFPIAATLNTLFGQKYILKDVRGTIQKGYKEGIISFNPTDIKPNTVVPSVVIEAIHYPSANTKKDTVLYTQANQNITLEYNENRIEFQYVALHFTDAANNKYAYQLVGYDKDWIQAGIQRSATYTNLSSGTYTFKVKAANSDGLWNETGTSITIKILPPWWKTWWAYCLYALVIGGSIWWYVQYRSKALRKENEVLEKKVTLRTVQLEQKSSELEIKSTELEKSIDNLKSTQNQLIQKEKLASLGELTAGIAHEIQNPLNFVNNFSELSVDLVKDLKDEMAKPDIDKAYIEELFEDLSSNQEKINHHGKRASSIVKGMLEHSRASTGERALTDINALADEYLRLSYHGMRAKDKSFNADYKTDFDGNLPQIEIVSQDIGRVLLNLYNNAFYAVNERAKAPQPPKGEYIPIVTVRTRLVTPPLGAGGLLEIRVKDNGNGIPENIKSKIFQPFFTTKPTGEGTGLGLSLAYDIMTKGHSGTLEVESTEGVGSEFIIHLPFKTIG